MSALALKLPWFVWIRRAQARMMISQTLPGSSTRAISAVALFVAVQIADAFLTAAGVSRFGMPMEGNPVLLRSMMLLGPSATLWGAKSIAVLCGGILYRCERHLILTLLTIVYVFGAIVPWSMILFR
jgi:hypothetical protein